MAEITSTEDSWRSLNILTCKRCNLKTSDSAFLQFHHCKTKAQQIITGVNNNRDNRTLCGAKLPEHDFRQQHEAQSHKSVTVSAAVQKKVKAPSLSHLYCPVSSNVLFAQSPVPPVIQPASLKVQPQLASMPNFNARTYPTRPPFSTGQQRVLIVMPQMTTSPTYILQTQVPVSLPFVPVTIPNLSMGLPSTLMHEKRTFVSNNFPVVGQDVQSHRAETHMASSTRPISVSKVHNSTIPHAAENIEGHLRNSSFVSSSASLNHQNLVNLSNNKRVNLEPSVRNKSQSLCDNLNSDSHIITSQECQEVPNSFTHMEQGCSFDTTVKRYVSPAMRSDWPMKNSVENVMSLSGGQDDFQQNIASDSTFNTEHTTNPWDDIAEQQRRTVGPDNFSFLRVVKGYFLCLICRMKWCTEYDLFFKHIWSKHVHGIDFSCCPMGYSTSCARLKAVVSTIYNKSQESMSDQIRNYFMTEPSTIDFQTVNETSHFPEQSTCSSAEDSDPVCVSTGSETPSQPIVDADVRPTSANSFGHGNVPYILPQILQIESFTHYEKSTYPSESTFNPEQLGTPVQSYRWEYGQNKVSGNLTSDNGRDEALGKALEQAVSKQTPTEANTSIVGIVETLRCLPEQQQKNISTANLDNTEVSRNSTHKEINTTGNIYEDISNDGYDDSSRRSVNIINDLLHDNYYTEELPLDLSKKAPQCETSMISQPLSVNEAHITGSTTRMDRISTESFETDDETSLMFFYQCGFHGCLFASSNSRDFQFHNQQTHNSENEFPCIYCRLKNASSKYLINHMEKHLRNTETKTFSCLLLENSDKVAEFENNDMQVILRMLKNNFAANSDSGTVFHCVCNICSSEFIDLQELENHLQKSLLKVIECKHCESYFLNFYSWQKHMATEHLDLPRLYIINKKLLCYDRKQSALYDLKKSADVYECSSHSGSNLCQLENSEIAVLEKQGRSKHQEPPASFVILPSVMDDTETTRVLMNKSESLNVNSQSIHMTEVQPMSEERIHMALPVGNQMQGINRQQIPAISKSVNHICSTSPEDYVTVNNRNVNSETSSKLALIMTSSTHQENSNLTSNVSHLASDCLVVEEKSSTMTENDECIKRSNLISEATNSTHAITNSLEIDNAQKGLVTSGGIELQCREKTVLQDINTTNICTILKTGHSSSAVKAINITHLTDDNLKSHAQQHARNNKNFDSVKVTKDRNVSLLKDGRDNILPVVMFASSSNHIAESQEEEQELTNMTTSKNTQATAEIYTQVTNNQNTLVSVRLDGEKSVLTAPLLVAPCLKQLHEKELMSSKPTDSLTKPTDSLTKPTDSLTKPTDSLTKPTDSLSVFQQSENHAVKRISAYRGKLEISGTKNKVMPLASVARPRQIINSLSLYQEEVDLPTIGHISDVSPHKEVECLILSQKYGVGSKVEVMTDVQNASLDNESTPSLQQDFSPQSKTALEAKQMKQNNLISKKDFLSRNRSTVNTQEPFLYSDLRKAIGDGTFQDESHKEESLNPPSCGGNSEEIQVLISSREEHDSTSSSMKKITPNQGSKPPKLKQSNNNCQVDRDNVVLSQKPFIQKKATNSFTCCQCGSDLHNSYIGKSNNSMLSTTEQSQIKSDSLMCAKCRFVALGSSLLSKSILKTSKSSQFAQKVSPASKPLLMKTSSESAKNVNDSASHRLIDECGSAAMDQCLTSLYTSCDNKFVCKKCKQNFNSLKRIHCHCFYCQGKVGVVHCSDCLYQGEHEKAVGIHIKHQHCDEAVNITVKHRCFQISELMEILHSQTISSDTFMDICAKLSLPKNIDNKSDTNPSETSFSKKSANNEISSQDSSLCIIPQVENPLILTEHHSVPFNSGEKLMKPPATKSSSVMLENNVKISALTASKNYEECTSVLGPSVDNVVNPNPCTTLPLISGNAEQPKMQEILYHSNVLLSDKIIQNLSTFASRKDEENITPDLDKSEKKSRIVYSGPSINRPLHNKVASETRKSSVDIKVSNSDSAVKRKSEDVCDERASETTSDKEIMARLYISLVDTDDDKISIYETTKLDNIIKVNSNGKTLKEKLVDRHFEGIRNSEMSKSHNVNNNTPVNKQSENRCNSGVNTSKAVRTNKDITVSCKDPAVIGKSKLYTELSYGENKKCHNNSTSNTKPMDIHGGGNRTPEVTSSDKEIKLSHVVKAVRRSSQDKFDNTISIHKTTQPNKDKVGQINATLGEKSKVRHEVTRSINMNKISHTNVPFGKKSEIRQDEVVNVPNVTKSAKENIENHDTTVNRQPETKIPDIEINDIEAAGSRKSENVLSAKGTAAKTIKSDTVIRIGHSDKALKQKCKDRQFEVIGPHSTSSDNKIQVKGSDVFQRNAKSLTVRSYETIETTFIDTTSKAQSDDGHNEGICATETTSSNIKSKSNYNDTITNGQLVDGGNEGISTPEIRSENNNKENCNDTESRLSGSGLNKVGHETTTAFKAARVGEESNVKDSDSTARRKSQDRYDADTSVPATARTDNNKLICNDTTARLDRNMLSSNDTTVRRRSEGGYERGTAEAIRPSEVTQVSHRDPVVGRKSPAAQQEGISTPKTARTSKEMKDRQKSNSHSEGVKAPETTRPKSKINNSNSTVNRKSIDRQDERISIPETNRSVKIKLNNMLNDTKVARRSEERCDDRISMPKESNSSDKLIKVVCSDTAVKNQTKSDSSSIENTWSCRKMKVSHIDSAVEITTDDTLDESIVAYKFTKINNGTNVIGNSTAVKRKAEERLEMKANKQHRSTDALQSSTEMHNTGQAIPDSSLNTKSSASQSIKLYSSPKLKMQIKSQNGDMSEKVCRAPSRCSQPVPSDRHAKKRKHIIYRCIHRKCDFTCEWNIDNMKEHINKNHPYYSCGYCNAPYTLLLFLQNHQKFVHKESKLLIAFDAIPLDQLFKRIDECNNSPNGDYLNEVTNRTQSLEFPSRKRVKKCRNKSFSELTTSTNYEEPVLSCSFDAGMTSNQPDVASKTPSGISDKAAEEHAVNQSILPARKSLIDKMAQSKPESILEQFLMESSLTSRHEETVSEMLITSSSINAVSKNVNSIPAKTDRNLFERSSFMNNAKFDIGASNASQTTSSKLINVDNTIHRFEEKSSTVGNLNIAKMFKLNLHFEERLSLKKNVKKNYQDSSQYSHPTEIREHVNKDLDEHQKLVQSCVLKATASLENLPPNGTVYKDALKNNSSPSSTSQDAYNQVKTLSKSTANFNKFNKVPKFKSASDINIYEAYSQQRIPSITVKKQDLSLVDISQATNLSAIKTNANDDHQKSKGISETLETYFSDDMMFDGIKTNAYKIMTPRSTLRTGSEENCGTWTVSHMETKTAAEGIQNMEFEPENMRTNLLRESITLQNGSKISKHGKEVSKTEYPFRCTRCKRIAKCLNDIEEHFNECHPTEPVKLTERISGFVYSSSGQCLVGKDHKKTPTHSHMCRYCPFRSIKRSDVEDHISTDHPIEDVLVYSLKKPISSVPGTNTELSSEITFEDQAPQGNPSTVTYYNCIMCDTVESSEFLFRLHLAKHPCFKHTSLLSTGASFVCPTCGYVAKSKNDLAQHTGEHMSERRFKCFMCEYDGHKKQGVKTHLRSVHNINMDDDTGVIDRVKQRSLDSRPRLVNINPQVLLNTFNYTHFSDM